jgi:hypothetical protein
MSRTTFRSSATQLTDQSDQLGPQFRMALAALDLVAGDHPLALSRALELRDDHRFVELRDCSEYLPDELRCGCAADEFAVRSISFNQPGS